MTGWFSAVTERAENETNFEPYPKVAPIGRWSHFGGRDNCNVSVCACELCEKGSFWFIFCWLSFFPPKSECTETELSKEQVEIKPGILGFHCTSNTQLEAGVISPIA
eukprot:Lithocolla_globosa_v1_NODE_281_length_4678_cov_13.661043.p4 type:complete len:107 gc:universal NODE_281_length_4678_cov_13.661043:2357-2037(-)